MGQPVHGDGNAGSRHNLGLQDVLEGKVGRKYAEELAESEPQTPEEIEREPAPRRGAQPSLHTALQRCFRGHDGGSGLIISRPCHPRCRALWSAAKLASVRVCELKERGQLAA